MVLIKTRGHLGVLQGQRWCLCGYGLQEESQKLGIFPQNGIRREKRAGGRQRVGLVPLGRPGWRLHMGFELSQLPRPCCCRGARPHPVLTPSPDAPAGPWGSHPPLPPPDPLPTTRLLFSPLSTVLPPSPPVTYCTLSQPSSIYGPQSPVSCQPRPILLHFVPFFLLRARCAPISLPSASSRAAALSALWVIDP